MSIEKVKEFLNNFLAESGDIAGPIYYGPDWDGQKLPAYVIHDPKSTLSQELKADLDQMLSFSIILKEQHGMPTQVFVKNVEIVFTGYLLIIREESNPDADEVTEESAKLLNTVRLFNDKCERMFAAQAADAAADLDNEIEKLLDEN